MSEKIDKPSDIEFAKALVAHIPQPNKRMVKEFGAAWIAAEVWKHVTKSK